MNKDPIWSQAYTELMISCQFDGCSSVFELSLSNPASDPVEDWASDLAASARAAGWAVDAQERILCERHASLEMLQRAWDDGKANGSVEPLDMQAIIRATKTKT